MSCSIVGISGCTGHRIHGKTIVHRIRQPIQMSASVDTPFQNLVVYYDLTVNIATGEVGISNTNVFALPLDTTSINGM